MSDDIVHNANICRLPHIVSNPARRIVVHVLDHCRYGHSHTACHTVDTRRRRTILCLCSSRASPYEADGIRSNHLHNWYAPGDIQSNPSFSFSNRPETYRNSKTSQTLVRKPKLTSIAISNFSQTRHYPLLRTKGAIDLKLLSTT